MGQLWEALHGLVVSTAVPLPQGEISSVLLLFSIDLGVVGLALDKCILSRQQQTLLQGNCS